MKLFIVILLIFNCFTISAQVFDIDLNGYITMMSSLTLLDLGNNYIDQVSLKNLDQKTLSKLTPEDIPAFDRWSPRRNIPTIKDFSDYTNWVTISTSLYLLSDSHWVKNYLVMGEIIHAQSVIGKWVKTLTHRIRPYSYDKSGDKQKSNQHSFYSLHASSAFAAARVSYYYYRENGGENILVPIILYSGATSTAILRVLAGQHFTSDVIIGAIMGTLIADQLIKINTVNPLNLDLKSDYIGLSYRF